MKRSLLALALAGAALVPGTGASAAGVTPGCDNPVDVACNRTYCPGEACTPIICLVWLNGRCVVD